MTEELVYSRRREEFYLRGGDSIPGQVYLNEVELPHGLAVRLSVSSVVAALRACVRHQGARESSHDIDGNERTILAEFTWGIKGLDFEPGEGIVQSGSIALGVDMVPRFSVLLWAVEVDGDWDASWTDLEVLIRQWATPRGLTLQDFGAVARGDHFVWQADFSIIRRGLDIAYLDELVDDLEALAGALERRQLDAESIRGLVRGGRGSALLGLPEGPQLDAKREIRLGGKNDELELAKDVASFANTGDPGIIVLGIATKRRRGYDQLAKIHHVNEMYTASKIRRAIDRNTFPRVEALEVSRVPSGEEDQSELVYIYIPAQPRPLMPFLVAGSVIDERTESVYLGIPTRRDDETAMMSMQELHSILRVGLAIFEQDRPIRHIHRG